MNDKEKRKFYTTLAREHYRTLNAEARELVIFAENTGEIYSWYCQICKNFNRKLEKNIFDMEAAQRAFSPWLVKAAKIYVYQCCTPGDKYFKIFSAETRKQAALYFVYNYLELAFNGEMNWLDEEK
jgi:hypothetical protein